MQGSRARSEGAAAPAASGVVDGDGGAGERGAIAGDDTILDDVLVEDVSIDGMCGVY